MSFNYKCGRWAGPRLRCFLTAGLLGWLALASGLAKSYAAASCAPIPEMSIGRLQGTVYGPSGVPLPQIVVKVMRDGIPVNQAQTDDKGRFEFKGVAPGNVVVRIQFMGSKTLDLNVRVNKRAGLFHTARVRVVLGLSGTRCSFATTNNGRFKDQIKRYGKQLEEVYTGP
ncbi:carboxypeptidase regulatory-like domain-containing protein [Acidobacteria bacterium AB60]|nr:carboxypeptidase regulatory-like domain-containing protein [Acidobacteria bacterium AB60]